MGKAHRNEQWNILSFFMVKNIKYDADTKDLASLMNEEKAKNYSQIAWGVFIILIALIQLLPLFSNDVFVNEKIESLQ